MIARDLMRDAQEAKLLLDNVILHRVLSETESAAIDRAVFASPSDHEGRQAALAQALAIRNVWQSLKTIAETKVDDQRQRIGVV